MTDQTKKVPLATNDANAKSQAAQNASEQAKAHAAENAAVHNQATPAPQAPANAENGVVEVDAVVVHDGELTPEDTQPVDATGAPLTTEDAQTYQSPESQEPPASSVVYAPETQEPLDVEETAEAEGIRRTFTDSGYVIDDYSQVNAPEENDFEAVVVEEDNDLEK